MKVQSVRLTTGVNGQLERSQRLSKALGINHQELLRRAIEQGLAALESGADAPRGGLDQLQLAVADLAQDVLALGGLAQLHSEEISELFRVMVETMIGVRMCVARLSPDTYADMAKSRDKYLQVRAGERRQAVASLAARAKP